MAGGGRDSLDLSGKVAHPERKRIAKDGKNRKSGNVVLINRFFT
jgi:hypothetical protein